MADELAESAPSAEDMKIAEAKVERELRAERLERSGVSGAVTAEDFEAVCDDTLKSTHALSAVRRWLVGRAKNPRPFTTLALVGETGRGKTLAGAWLIAKLGGYYTTADGVRRLFSSYGWKDGQKLEDLMRSRVLVLDDVGTEQRPEESVPAIYEVVNARAGLARGWTLITGNLAEDVLRARYGERTIRRIEHQGAMFTVKGPDLRRGRGDF